MEPIEPEGRLVIEFMDGITREIMFKDCKSHSLDEHELIVRFEDHREQIPIIHIRTLGVYYNSEEYVTYMRMKRLGQLN
jgi:hypothetical protein